MKKVKEDLVALGFHVANKDELYPLNDWIVRNGERIEIFWFLTIDNECIYTDIIRYPKKYFTNLAGCEFLGLFVDIPRLYKEFLAYHYGKTWRTPKRGAKGPVTKPNQKPPIVEDEPLPSRTLTTLAEFENELAITIQKKKQLQQTIRHLRGQKDGSK